MAQSAVFQDPFGCPEFYVDGVAYREMVGSELVRTSFFACDRGERILRVKLLIPCAIATTEHAQLRAFLAREGPRLAS